MCKCVVEMGLEGAGFTRVHPHKTRLAQLWGVAFSRRTINRVTGGLESNGRLGVPSKATADVPQPLLRIHFSSTISIPNLHPTPISHPTLSKQHPLLLYRQGSQHILLLPWVLAVVNWLLRDLFQLLLVRCRVRLCRLAASLESPPISFPSRNHSTPRYKLGHTLPPFFVHCTAPDFDRARLACCKLRKKRALAHSATFGLRKWRAQWSRVAHQHLPQDRPREFERLPRLNTGTPILTSLTPPANRPASLSGLLTEHLPPSLLLLETIPPTSKKAHSVPPNPPRSASFPSWQRLLSRRKRSACPPWTHRAGLRAL